MSGVMMRQFSAHHPVMDSPVRRGSPPPGATPGVVRLVACFTWDNLGLTYDFDGSCSIGDIVSWDWDFDDGDTDSGETVSHEFASGGTYNVQLVVTDGDGNTASRTQAVEVII